MEISSSMLLDATAPFREGAGLPISAGATGTEDVGQQFESLFVSMLLKEMRASSTEDGLFAGDSADIYGGMFDLFLGQHIASQGAFGVAEMINSQLAPAADSQSAQSGAAEPPPPATAG